jgi:Tfp pilus assembly protein PilV
MKLPPTPAARPGLSLIEVLVALAIFLFSLIAIGGLVSMAGDRALDIQQMNEATRLCQSKMNEVVIGAVPLQPQSDTSDDDSGWFWSLDCQQGDAAPNLWTCTVKVYRKRGDSSQFGVTLTQMVLDPSVRGSTLDTVAVNGSDTGSGSSSANGTGSSSPSGSASPQQGSSMPSGMTGGSAMPKSGSSPSAGAAPKAGNAAPGTGTKTSTTPPASGTTPARGTTPSPAPKGKG